MKKEYEATNYESDLTDEQWEAIQEFFPSGNKSKYHKRSLVEAVLYIVKIGCQWRMLPHDYPPHDTVWSFYRRARNNGVWDKIMGNLDYDFSCCYALKTLMNTDSESILLEILGCRVFIFQENAVFPW